ncbi:MAG: transketolase [Candidatus Magnetominusculus sp. LBB02]|nr:transketolase [Candidatus Magnetominusculus sp. LBB02]
MTKIDELCINTIRMLSIDAVQKADSGHPGMPMGDADMAYVLWTKFLKHSPSNPHWFNRDRFILSAGHGSMLLYSLLHLTGYEISLNDIKNFRQFGSKTPGHPEYDVDTGIEVSTGPLGYGFAVGVGMAMAERYMSETFNRPGFNVVDYNIYAIVSDGDIMEGVSYESASLAGHLKLGKLIYLYSSNNATIDGSTDLTFSEDVAKRFEAMGWHVEQVDGYKLPAIEKAISRAKEEKKRPSLIIANTHLGYGSPNKQDISDIHGAPLGDKEVELTKQHFGWPQKTFYVPKEVAKHCRQAIEDGKKEEADWNSLLKKYKTKMPELAVQFEYFMGGKLNSTWKNALPHFDTASGAIATRSASGNVLNALSEEIPNLIGGSADLSPSNMTCLKKHGRYGQSKVGRNIHFGIREFAMGAVLTGMALSKSLIPYGGTYLVFSSFMYPSIRMSALMKAHVIFILTHDSIGVGEDGPSHHPIEQLTTLRLIPNLLVMRPADANETVKAWELALEYEGGPVALVLTRQSVPVIDRKQYASHEGLAKGAYVLADSGKPPELILIASGSETHLALGAYVQLLKEGVAVRCVSMPSFALFEKQSAEYKESVLPLKVKKRLAVEAGSSLGWHKYVGLDGEVLGIDTFGISAPAKQLFEHFGFTVENVLKRARALLAK